MNPERNEKFQKFRSSRQPQVCLEIAMEEFFRRDLPEEFRGEYEKYLHQRLRPMVAALIDRDQVEALQQVDELGWLSESLLEEFTLTAARSHKGPALMWLLEKRQQQGFRKPDFSL